MNTIRISPNRPKVSRRRPNCLVCWEIDIANQLKRLLVTGVCYDLLVNKSRNQRQWKRFVSFE